MNDGPPPHSSPQHVIFISRASLRNPRSHGFFRFFAWEAIAGLFLLNMEHWFENPFAWYQIIAWIALCACVVPVVWGTVLLMRVGKPVEQREADPTLLAIEKTTQLVTTGIYKHIRHPLYSSLLLLAWGIFFKRPSWLGGGRGRVHPFFRSGIRSLYEKIPQVHPLRNIKAECFKNRF